ncbi:MAG: hypothetical protein AAFV88_18410 [Planctomycetota bacterium]
MILQTMMYLVLFAALLAASMQTLALIRASEMRSQERTQFRRDLRRFADELRRDVSKSDSMSVTANQLTLRSSGRELVYEMDGSIVRRTLSGDSPAREVFRFGPDAEQSLLQEGESGVRWQVRRSDQPGEDAFEILAVRRTP